MGRGSAWLRRAGRREGCWDEPGSRRRPGGGGKNALPHFPSHRRGKPAVSLQASTVLLVFPTAAGWLRRATAGLRGAGSSTPGPAPASKPWESEYLGSGSGVISLERGTERRETFHTAPSWHFGRALLLETVSNLFPQRIGLCGHFRAAGSFCTGPRSEGDLFITLLQGGSEGKKYSC